MGKELILYSRTDCALCLEMEEELRPILRDTSITVRPVNIEGDHELQHRYGARIPVLVSGNQEICELKLDVDALRQFLKSTIEQ